MHSEGSLASGVVALLEARGERKLAELVGRSGVEIVGAPEQWMMGAREVNAYRVALVVSAEDHVFLGRSADKLGAIREAFVGAIHSPMTELGALEVVLGLPPSTVGFHRTYRDAPMRAPEPPSAEAVLGGAARLLAAMGEKVGAEMLSRAAVEDVFVEGAARPLRRFLVRLDAADYARAGRDAALGDRLVHAVREAAATAVEVTNAVHLGVRSYGLPEAVSGVEESFVRALERKGAAVVPVFRDEQTTRLVVVARGAVVLVDVTRDRRAKVRVVEEEIAQVVMPVEALSGAEAIEKASEQIVEQMKAR